MTLLSYGTVVVVWFYIETAYTRASILLSWVALWALGFVRAGERASMGGWVSGSSLTLLSSICFEPRLSFLLSPSSCTYCPSWQPINKKLPIDTRLALNVPMPVSLSFSLLLLLILVTASVTNLFTRRGGGLIPPPRFSKTLLTLCVYVDSVITRPLNLKPLEFL
jgi:hypothetical protein